MNFMIWHISNGCSAKGIGISSQYFINFVPLSDGLKSIQFCTNEQIDYKYLLKIST